MKRAKLILLFSFITLLGGTSLKAQIASPGDMPTVTGNASYCAGSSGAAVGIDLSDVGVTYILYKDGIAQTPTYAGTGSAISFGPQLVGTYTVKAYENITPANIYPIVGSAIITLASDMVVGGASSSPTLCTNTALTPITHTTTGATGIGTATGLPAGVTAAWASNTITISGTPTASGTFNYSIPLTGGCGNITATGTIVVTAANTASAASSAPTLCANTTLTPITHTTTGATGIGTATGLPAGVTAEWASNTITISGTPTTAETYNYSIPLTGGCSSVNATGTITVSAANTVGAASASPTLCINSALTPITHTTTGATGIGTATGLPTGVSAAWASNTITISGTPTSSGTFNYSIPLTGGCSTVNATGTITVTAANTASTASATPTLCINAVLTDITHTTTGATGIGTATGLPTGVTAAWAANTITISGTPTASGTFNYSIPLTGGCTSVYATGTITVSAANTVGAASANPTLCINTPLTAITHTTTGATGIGTATGLPAGVNAAWASNTITISGTPSEAGTFNYTIQLAGGCATVNATGTITVTAANTAGVASATPTLCLNTTLTPITHTTTGASGIGTATGLPTGVTAAWASNTITISGTPTIGGTYNYSIPLTGGCSTIYATGTIVVTAANTASAASATPTLCINTTLTPITHTTTGTTGIGSATGLPAGVTAAWASNTITISGTPSASGTFNYTIPLSGGCEVVNATGTITVTAANTASIASATPTLCINTALTPITHTTTGATGIGTATGLPAGVSAAWASNTITISGTPTTSGTFNYSIPLSGGCATINATGTITVSAATAVSSQSTAGQSTCINTTYTPISVTATGTSLSYQWYSNSSASTSGGTAVGTNSNSYTPLATTAGTLYYYCVVTGTCSSATSAISGAFITNAVTPASVTISSSVSLNDDNVLEGTPVTFTATPIGGGANPTYQWYRKIGTGAYTAVGTGTATYTYTPTNGNRVYVIMTSNAPCISGSPATSNTVVMFVNPPQQFNVTGTATYCAGTGGDIGLDGSEAGVTYTLYKGGVAQTPTVAGTGTAITFGTRLVGTYTVKATKISTMDMLGDAIISEFPATAISTQSTATQTQTIGSTFTAMSVTATGTGTLSYQWYSNTTASTTDGTLISGATTNSYTPSASTLGTTYYYCVASSDCGTATSTISGAIVVIPNVRQLSLKVLLQGLYNTTNGNMNKCQDYTTTAVDKYIGTISDLITVELHNATTYATIEYSATAVELHQDGTCNNAGLGYIEIPAIYTGNYYITIKTRNHVETTTATPVSFGNINISYDFTTAADKAYGSNLKQLATGVFGIYLGDINASRNVNVSDRDVVISKANVGTTGYATEDINGNGNVNVTDRDIVIANINSGIQCYLPN